MAGGSGKLAGAKLLTPLPAARNGLCPSKPPETELPAGAGTAGGSGKIVGGEIAFAPNFWLWIPAYAGTTAGAVTC